MAANLEYDEVPETSTELEDDKEDPLPTLTVCATGVNIDSDGTVTATENGKLGMLYVAFLQALLKPSTAQGRANTRRACNWVHRRTPGLRWRLLLSEAQGQSINWKKMGSIAGDWRARGEAPPLLNFSRGFKLLCRKAMLCTTLRQYALARPVADVHTWFPPSFVFYPAKPEQSEKDAFLKAFERRRASETVSATATGNSNVWILKPSDGGKGERIKVLSGNNGPTEILHFLETQPAGSISWVVSEYLERPLLLPGRRKFDWRLWVHLDTVTYAIRLYREGVLRTCSVSFSLANLSDEFAHLSNHCIQVNSKSYGGHEPTNEMFYDEFERVLQEQQEQEVEAGGSGCGDGVGGSGGVEREGGERRSNGVCSGSSGGSLLETVLLPQAHRVIVETLLSARGTLQCNPDLTGAACFNVFGFDLMVDQDFGVQLIEVNSSPAVADGLLDGLVTGLVGVVQLQLDGNQRSASPSASSLTPSLVSFNESDASGDDGGSEGGGGYGDCEATSGSKDDDGDGGWELLFAGGSSPPPSVPFPHPLQARR
mmetsp:Transcript_29057/g.59436  ORF Transcript_29057/g.59436 Transcript_29057/m.59436 type:complete len:541 (+) Transcript_29057:54-1676(+)